MHRMSLPAKEQEPAIKKKKTKTLKKQYTVHPGASQNLSAHVGSCTLNIAQRNHTKQISKNQDQGTPCHFKERQPPGWSWAVAPCLFY